jgi:Fic family protein
MVYGFRVNLDFLTEQRRELDRFRPLPPEVLRNLERWFLIELTYTSNALEGNTLTRLETAVVVEKGLAVGGKSLAEHLEATNHAAALDKVVRIAKSRVRSLTEHTLLDLHAMILRGLDDSNAGRYRSIPVRISGSRVVLPNPVKVPSLMTEFFAQLTSRARKHPVQLAAEAHYRLVTIHPFIDGNGRTARLLMNLILLQHGYPPALIRKRDRVPYLKSLEKAQLGGSNGDYLKIIARSVERSFRIYFEALGGEPAPEKETGQLLRIGELAKKSGETHATLRHWMKEGLIECSETTPSGYQLFGPETAERAKRIRRLQSKRHTLAEIRQELRGEEK